MSNYLDYGIGQWDPQAETYVDYLNRLYDARNAAGGGPALVPSQPITEPPAPVAAPAPTYVPPAAPPPPTAPFVGSSAGVGGLTPDQLNTQSIITATLRQYGLDTPDVLAWARNAIVNGATADQVNLEIYDPSSTPGKVVAQKYPELAARNAKGLTPITIAQAAQYHDTVKSLVRNSGLPTGFYDSDAEISSLLTNDVSATELKDRIDNGFLKVSNADPAIRQAFNQFYGAYGDQALATYFLDPTKAQPILEKEVAAAQVGGVGSAFGYQVGKGLAEQLAGNGVTDAQARAGFGKLNDLNPAFDENFGENQDLTALGAGAQAVFGTGGTGAQDVQKRLEERTAAFQGGGSAQVGTTGAYGLGAARSL